MSNRKPKKPIPDFASDQDEADFWGAHDTTEYDLGLEVEMGADLGGCTRSISIRLPERLLTAIRAEAERRRMPYQRLMRMVLERYCAAREHVTGGWQSEMTPGTRVFHYIRNMTSLCRRVGFYRGDLVPHVTGSPRRNEDCAGCYRCLNKRRVEVSHG